MKASGREETKVEKKEEETDFRTKQIHELEKLQQVLDENNILRAKFNCLSTQVAPLIDSFGPAPTNQQQQFQSEKTMTPEEIEALKQKLEQTLAEYREETRQAGLLNSEIERQYTELSSLKMHFRLDQDERLTKQNQSSNQALINFRDKSHRVNETSNVERDRLQKAIILLNNIQDSSNADIKEFEEQTRTNNKGIQHLSSSITIAKEDIRDYSDQIQKLEPKLQEYEQLKEKHQQSEELVVKLNDELESLRKQVDTQSLTANVRRQIDLGNRTIEDLNRQIDLLLAKASQKQDKCKEARTRIADLQYKLEKTTHETDGLKRVKNDLKNKKQKIIDELNNCREMHETAGGENDLLSKKIADGITVGNKAPWQIRKELLNLKAEIKQLDSIQKTQSEFENKLSSSQPTTAMIPQRKRVAMIPMKKV